MSGLPRYLFHGTSTHYLENMLAEGLKPCSMTGAVLMCCYADDVEIAAWHAQCMAEDEDAEPIVFMVEIDRFDPRKFTLEDKFVELGPSEGRGLALCEAMGEEAWTTHPWTWQEMLAKAGAVGYTIDLLVSKDDLLPGRGLDEWRVASELRAGRDRPAAPMAA